MHPVVTYIYRIILKSIKNCSRTAFDHLRHSLAPTGLKVYPPPPPSHLPKSNQIHI